MSVPLPLSFERLAKLRFEHGTLPAGRMARREAIVAELDKENPDLPAVIMTLLELIGEAK